MQAYIAYASSVVETGSDGDDEGDDESDYDDDDEEDDESEDESPRLIRRYQRAAAATINADIARQRLATLHATLTSLVNDAHTNDIRRWTEDAHRLVHQLVADGGDDNTITPACRHYLLSLLAQSDSTLMAIIATYDDTGNRSEALNSLTHLSKRWRRQYSRTSRHLLALIDAVIQNETITRT
jgi:hypothetical protein